MSMNMGSKGMMRSTLIIGLATALSRVLGFARDIVFANFFGTGMIAQAFVVAFRIPNTLRDLVGEGAMNSAIVPVLSEYKALGSEREFARASSILFNISLIVLSMLTMLGIIFSPAIVRVMAPGFIADPEKFQITVTMNRTMFPYLVLVGLAAYSMGLLNSLKSFAPPAFGPCLMNLAMIASIIWLYPIFGVMGLAIGVLAGGAIQLAVNVVSMYGRGIRINLGDGFRHEAIKRVGRLLAPRILGSAIYEINVFVDTVLASLSSIVGAGGVAALYYANRLIQFPLAIFAIALAQVALPKMSGEYASNDIARLKDTLSFSMRSIFLIMVPSGLGLAVLGEPIVKVLFQRGAFTAYSTDITGGALFFYSFGLIAYGGVKLLATTFYSMHDTMTPVRTALWAVAMNVLLNLMLIWPMKLKGLALATSVSAAFNFVMLFISLKNRIGDFDTKTIAGSFARVLSASIMMTIVLKALIAVFPKIDIMNLCILIISGIISFVLAGFIFGVKEMRGFLSWISMPTLKRR